ncbi:hypothetical protein INS49_007372 [Diaporthe citri]|uniref:uncharacterized protein n=1 Tax=Diaporthe citri TaxID=83186 RepID=UPI001C81F6AA|nr:uncharacterized protein INS49_007372 [Diaporthe citri]KAG6365761.1 hypothetical protein INS49_007372 [Diaporthe citri]
MIATRSVGRGRSALHKSSQLHPRLLYPFALHSRLLMLNNNNININCCRHHNAPVGRLFQTRHAHTGAPFGWTNINQSEEPPSPPDPKEFTRPPSQPHERVRLTRRPTPPGSIIGPGPLLPRADSVRTGSFLHYHAAVKALLHALRRGDTFKLYLCLVSLVRGHKTETESRAFIEAVASIPATTFSEILRNFDPKKVAEEIDTAPDLNISYGAAVRTPLGELVNKWGIKILYVRILRRLLHIQLARRKAGLVPLMNDYPILMRCAGATSNHRVAKDIWYSMVDDRRANFRTSEAYSEFIKAKYLAEKMYANNDLSRFRVRPLDMHRVSLLLPGRVRLRLRYMAARITDRRKHRFGSDIHERFFDQPMTRIFRMRRPLMKLQRTTMLRGFQNANEDLICALLKVNGRAARQFASNSLLMHNWGIIITIDKETGGITIGGGITHPPDSPRAPTAALLDAIVHCYCCMGEVTLAVKLLDFVSQRFDIPVPDHVWSDLIEYTRVMESKPAANEWAIAGFPLKGARPNQVLEVWSLCTQAPHSFRPGARDYYNLIKSLVRKTQPMLKPVEALRQIKPLYDDAVDACEQAWCELMQTTQQDVPNHLAFRRYKALEARRNHMWYMFHYSSYLILKGVRPGIINDETAVREIPKLVGEFWQFLPRKVSYSIATGDVEFSSEAVRERDVVEVEQIVEKPRQAHEYRSAAAKGDGQAHVLRQDRRDGYSEDKGDLVPASPAAGEDHAPDFDERVVGDEPSPGRRMPRWWVIERREAEKPAYNFRPPWNAPSGQPSMETIRRDGGEFTGYYDDPLRRHFAAYRMTRTTRRVFGVPVDLERIEDGEENKKRRSRMVDELLRMRT